MSIFAGIGTSLVGGALSSLFGGNAGKNADNAQKDLLDESTINLRNQRDLYNTIGLPMYTTMLGNTLQQTLGFNPQGADQRVISHFANMLSGGDPQRMAEVMPAAQSLAALSQQMGTAGLYTGSGLPGGLPMAPVYGGQQPEQAGMTGPQMAAPTGVPSPIARMAGGNPNQPGRRSLAGTRSVVPRAQAPVAAPQAPVQQPATEYVQPAQPVQQAPVQPVPATLPVQQQPAPPAASAPPAATTPAPAPMQAPAGQVAQDVQPQSVDQLFAQILNPQRMAELENAYTSRRNEAIDLEMQRAMDGASAMSGAMGRDATGGVFGQILGQGAMARADARAGAPDYALDYAGRLAGLGQEQARAASERAFAGSNIAGSALSAAQDFARLPFAGLEGGVYNTALQAQQLGNMYAGGQAANAITGLPDELNAQLTQLRSIPWNDAQSRINGLLAQMAPVLGLPDTQVGQLTQLAQQYGQRASQQYGQQAGTQQALGMITGYLTEMNKKKQQASTAGSNVNVNVSPLAQYATGNQLSLGIGMNR